MRRISFSSSCISIAFVALVALLSFIFEFERLNAMNFIIKNNVITITHNFIVIQMMAWSSTDHKLDPSEFGLPRASYFLISLMMSRQNVLPYSISFIALELLCRTFSILYFWSSDFRFVLKLLDRWEFKLALLYLSCMVII